MKKLSEIGRLIAPDADSVTQFEPFVEMSLDERRELVRRVWEEAIKRRMENDYNFEEFIKEQQL